MFTFKQKHFSSKKINITKKHISIVLGMFFVVGISAGIVYFYKQSLILPTLSESVNGAGKAGESIYTSLTSENALTLEKKDADKEAKTTDAFAITDNQPVGIQIKFANKEETLKSEDEPKTEEKSIRFPKNYTEPITIQLNKEKTISILDQNAKYDYKQSILTGDEASLPGNEVSEIMPDAPEGIAKPSYLTYTSPDKRKTLYYAYQSDQALGSKQLKNWILYKKGTGEEQEVYTFQNAKLKKNEDGSVGVFYFGDKEIQNQKTVAEVDSNLLERAQKVVAQDMQQDLLNSNPNPDITVPRPYFIDKDGKQTDLDWEVDTDTNTIMLRVQAKPEQYPLALDPTLSFTVPGQSNTGSVITGEGTNNAFGYAFTSGDFNADGRIDLVVGAYGYSSSTGRAYIFYNDGSISAAAATPDVAIIGESVNSQFGIALTSGDFNADGKTDLAVGADGYSTSTGRAYIFYNDGSIPTTAATADVIITGQGTTNYFGASFTYGDFNTDGEVDLVVGAYGYANNDGRVYIFYNDGSIPTTAATADIIISGPTTTTNTYFASVLTSGDFNADGTIDLAVGAYGATVNYGRAYIFYNDGSIPTAGASADVIIVGTATVYFGTSLTSGDFNADGRTDLAVGASFYSTSTGRAYIFYNDGSIPTTAATADVIIGGETTNTYFGAAVASGDFNADGRTDLAVGATRYSTYTGRTYIFYNDGSIPTTAGTADVIITGETPNNYFGASLTSGDFNADGKTDLVASAYTYSTNTGRAYIFYSQNGQVNTNQNITGETTSNYFGYALTSGDFNADGKTDLAVGAYGYTTNTGRAYIFYNDGSIPTTAATADVSITGETSGDYFGAALTPGDFNADGKIDLAIGAYGYTTNTGRAYIFYNDGSIPTTAATADVIITGEANGNFGAALTAGDFNADGKTDLTVGAYLYSISTGRAYIFYNDGSIPTTAGTADVIITGEAMINYFGYALTSGDFNADGRTDLAVGATSYSAGTGRAYIFYNDGSIPTTAGTADVIITGEATGNDFGCALTSGDFNADGRTDLAAGAYHYSSNTGRTYIFYNDGSIPTTAGTADVIITGEATNNYFGYALTSGDFNADGRTDLAAGATGYSTSTGRAYIFYSDGSIPTTAATADVIITGEASSKFGAALTAGDFNTDGRTDLAVGSHIYSTNTGRVYVYETRDNYAWKMQEIQKPDSMRINSANGAGGQELKITGAVAGENIGTALASGDFNADGKTDLAVGANAYSSNTGRVYIFYNDGSISTTAAAADITITGESANSLFGSALTAGDFNADGKIDLAVGAYWYSTNTGRVNIFYNDGSIPTAAANADVIITGETTNNYFGYAITSGDFNADGTIDLAIGAYRYSMYTGRAYVFYNDGSIPTAAASADVIITGQAVNNFFGFALTSGDFNADGEVDLAVGASGYSSDTGRTYIFYNDGSIPTTAATADVIITGESPSNYFGAALIAGDFNADGTTDLIVSAHRYASYFGRVYLLYNDGSIPTTAATADVIITGEAMSSFFGYALTSGDFNSDGKTDFAVGAYGYSTNTGRINIFYNDGSIPTTGATADVRITGESTNNYFGYTVTSGDFNADGKTDLVTGAYNFSSGIGRVYMYTFNDTTATGEGINNNFGYSLVSGDFNADGKTDLAVGAYGYTSNTGRAYIFYNDGSIATTAATADMVITGEAVNNYFGIALTSGDFNADGKTDLAVGAYGYTSNTGRAYIFYNDGSIPATAATADITITGEGTSNQFGIALTSDDFNSDGKTDLAVGANGYFASTGRAYIFHNDGSIPTTAATADITITGEGVGNYFGYAFASGDFNADGKTDLAIGAYAYTGSTGRAYIFYNDGSIPTTAAAADVIITGETTTNYFAFALVSGDFNADGKTDLAIGAYAYNSFTGRAYIFYNDGSIPTTAAAADVIITGETTTNYFAYALTSGDFNVDGRDDLVVGAVAYSTNTGRTYIFYNDGVISTDAASADVIITGEIAVGNFGTAFAPGDFNSDGKTDLVVGAYRYSSNAGKIYVYISEAKVVPEAGNSIRGSVNFRGTVQMR